MKKQKRFKAEVLSGHKDDAVEVPFDPSADWGLPPQALWRGRRGHVVQGTLNGFAFAETFVVSRARKFYLLLDRDLKQAAGIAVGDSVNLTLEPKIGERNLRKSSNGRTLS
jgi:ribosomal protein L21E